jgi:hypothetical protein
VTEDEKLHNDIWNTAVKVGAARERGRIIELLETHCEEKHFAICDESSCYDLIALIKGENK